MGWMYLVNSVDQFFSWMLDITIAAVVIRITAGRIQTSSVRYARFGPPILKPTDTRVCVEAGPGRIWQSEFSSINSASVRYPLFVTNTL